MGNHPNLSGPPPLSWEFFKKWDFFFLFWRSRVGIFFKYIYLMKLLFVDVLFIPILNSLYLCSLDLLRCHIASNKTFNASIMTMYYYLFYLFILSGIWTPLYLYIYEIHPFSFLNNLVPSVSSKSCNLKKQCSFFCAQSLLLDNVLRHQIKNKKFIMLWNIKCY